MTDVPPIQRYKEHRERLLREVVRFMNDVSAAESRMAPLVCEYSEGASSIARDVRQHIDVAVREHRAREYLEFLLRDDSASLDLQRRWRVILKPDLTAPGTRLSFADSFFGTPVEALSPDHIRLNDIEPDRLLVIDRLAGQKPISRGLADLVEIRGAGDVSRVTSKPPFLLEDGRGEHDYAREDPVVVRVCMNGTPPTDFAEQVIAEVYPQLATRCGWQPGRRLRRHAPDADKWERYLKAIRRRLPELQRVVGPFPNDYGRL